MNKIKKHEQKINKIKDSFQHHFLYTQYRTEYVKCVQKKSP